MGLCLKVFVCLSIAISSTVGQPRPEESYFEDRVPVGYFSRSNLDDCRNRFHDGITRDQCLVFGGTRANATEFPHMAVIGWTDQSGGTRIAWKCGGSLITKRFVVTAAHCAVDEQNNAPSVVRFGDVNLASDEDDEYAQQLKIVRFIRHPQHRFSSKYNDIALIELEKEVNLTTGVCPACVWIDSYFPYDAFDVAGFGATGYAEQGSPYLLKAQLKTETTEHCTEYFESTRGLPNGIADDQLCASNIGMDTCQGDSGGPLQITLHTYNRKVATLVGVTSFGKSCGFGSIGVYQKIQPHIPWIELIVGETLDPLECARMYEDYRMGYLLGPECSVENPPANRVELHWEYGVHSSRCAGTLIDYNTVVTSASCTMDSAGKAPQFITILGQAVNITEVRRHPNYTPGLSQDNIALIRLKSYVKINSDIAPACPASGSFDYGLNSFRILRNTTSNTRDHMFLPVRHKCNDSSVNMDCWDANYRLIPGLCKVDEGGPLLDRSHSTLQGINVEPGECGSYHPLTVLKLDSYMAWIVSFVLDRSVTPEPPITFPEDDTSSLFFKPCSTRDGAEGVCLSHWGCGAEVERQKRNRTGVTMCGFEGDVGFICCPRDSVGKVPLVIPPPPLIPLIDLVQIKP
ncbi:polyserase-2-like [Aedes albopictus]|uniref:Peptidase S1 domain-containing protein n=1 Tax=Aedes albopictus TaxID=7160 RepID=A0ABM1YEI3_AEDAL